MSRLRRSLLLIVALLVAGGSAPAQKFLPDDPIQRDPDDLRIDKPAFVELSPTWNMVINSLGNEAEGPLLRAQNVNTVGEVPDSSWFTNRIGIRDVSIEELVQGNDLSGGPDLDGELTVLGAALVSVSEGMFVQDRQGSIFYLILEPAAYPRLVSGASIISNRIFHAAGYNVFPSHIVEVDPAQLRMDPKAEVFQLGGKRQPMDPSYLKLAFEDAARSEDGRYRAVALYIPPGAGSMTGESGSLTMGEFQFHGRRSDDPNDLYLHENRRELRGMRLFAEWLNFTFCDALVTRDVWVSDGTSTYLKHYLVDFSGSLGAGRDWEDRPVPKDRRSGHESLMPGNLGWTLKTALSLGFWYRPWMKIEFPSQAFPEIGRIEAEHFQPEAWVPEYPNAAFTRMLPDDAYWAAKIISRFTDADIDAIVREAKYRDAGAADLLADILKKRRDKIVDYYLRQINPIDDFRIEGGALDFRNLGEERGLAKIQAYEYEWFTLDNQSGELASLGDRRLSALTRLEIPKEKAGFLMARIRTRAPEARGWRKNVDVYLRMDADPDVVGMEREVGVFVLDRDLQGQQVVRSQIEFGGTYEGLELEQRRLVDAWIERFGKATGRSLDKQQFYEDLPMSVRTTFEGVTNALLESPLTDESGASLGRAIDLVTQIERVHGRILGVGGDQQFRMYCRLAPDTLEILEKSREFTRGADNTVYHKGYPISYRLQGGPPSIQISMQESGERADIDVDYRSSGFPAALVNGHLTSSNSDVRAGNNYQRHVNRWEGFVDWWRGLFGLASMRQMFGVDEPERLLIPKVSRKGDAKDVSEAIDDFLAAWMVTKEPEQSMAYVSEKAYYCMDVDVDEGGPDFGIAPYLMLERMTESAAALGNPRRLEDVIAPVSLDDPGLRLMEPERALPFTLYAVSEDLALSFDCADRDQAVPVEEGREGKFGDYFGAVFKVVGGPEGRRPTAALIWKKEEKKWKLVAYQIEPEGGESFSPDFTPPAAPTIQTVSADPRFAEAARQFLQAWGQGRIDEALESVGPSCADCYNLYRREDQPPLEGWQAVRPMLKEGLQRVYEHVSRTANLLDAIEAVEVVHPDVRLVQHERDDAITIMSLPDHLAEQYDCAKVARNQVDYRTPAEKRYGNHYAVGIRFKLAGEDAGVLYLVWSQVAGEWKITSYSILRP